MGKSMKAMDLGGSEKDVGEIIAISVRRAKPA
jgi:hypothetical protein